MIICRSAQAISTMSCCRSAFISLLPFRKRQRMIMMNWLLWGTVTALSCALFNAFSLSRHWLQNRENPRFHFVTWVTNIEREQLTLNCFKVYANLMKSARLCVTCLHTMNTSRTYLVMPVIMLLHTHIARHTITPSHTATSNVMSLLLLLFFVIYTSKPLGSVEIDWKLWGHVQ